MCWPARRGPDAGRWVGGRRRDREHVHHLRATASDCWYRSSRDRMGVHRAPTHGPSFGHLLRRYRLDANLTQEALAVRAGLTVQAVGMLERGRRRLPRRSTVVLLSQALRLDPARARALQQASEPPPPPGARGADGDARAQPPEPRSGIPPDPIPHFVGREPELAALERLLRRDRRVALHGLGGVGKTQLVVRYLHRNAADYPDGCFWLRADQDVTLVRDLASPAWRLR